jgi:hypothetical protein
MRKDPGTNRCERVSSEGVLLRDGTTGTFPCNSLRFPLLLLFVLGAFFASQAMTRETVYKHTAKRSSADADIAKSEHGHGSVDVPVAHRSDNLDPQIKRLENGTNKSMGRKEPHPHAETRITRASSHQETNLRFQPPKGSHYKNQLGQGSGSRRSGVGRRVAAKR